MAATVASLHRYPVKGLAPEALTSARMETGGGMPGDRRFAIARGRTAYDDARPKWLRKEAFVMLMRDGDERLARLRCAYADQGRTLEMTPPDGAPVRVDLGSAAGRTEAARVLNGLLGRRPDGPVRVVPAGPLSLTDIPQNGLSIINRASVADFARRVGRVVDPMRFRANVYVDGLPAWAERDWIGRTVHAGAVELAVDAHIERCKATEVDPATGARDLETVRLLRAEYGHFEMGVYAEVVAGGALSVGAPLSVASPAGAAAGRFGRALFYAKNAWILVRSRLGGSGGAQ
jgi:uncharacterized protein YcbX